MITVSRSGLNFRQSIGESRWTCTPGAVRNRGGPFRTPEVCLQNSLTLCLTGPAGLQRGWVWKATATFLRA